MWASKAKQRWSLSAKRLNFEGEEVATWSAAAQKLNLELNCSCMCARASLVVGLSGSIRGGVGGKVLMSVRATKLISLYF